MSADERIIEAREIAKTFPGGVVALDRFTLAVRRGEVVVIIGPSGSGKSTFLRCLNGLEEIDGGSIVIDRFHWTTTGRTASSSARRWGWSSSPSTSSRT